MKSYIEVIDALRNTTLPSMAIYKPADTARPDLYDVLYSHFSREYCVVFIEDVFLSSFEGMRKGLVDILVLPELELVRKEYFRPIKNYLDAGGAVLLAADDLFMAGKKGDSKISQFEITLAADEDYFRKTVAYLGIKPYVSDVQPAKTRFDRDFVPGSPAGFCERPLAAAGAGLNTGSDQHIPFPPVGHVFPERYEVLRNYEVATGCDPAGRRVNVPLVFAQNWENGSRIVLYASNGEDSLLNPEHPDFECLLDAAAGFALNKVMAVSCQPEYACYREGEAVKVFYELSNHHAWPVNVDATIEISDGGQVLYQKQISNTIGAFSVLHDEILWVPGSFRQDFYQVDLKLKNGEQTLSRVSNGFTVWQDAVVNSMLPITAAGKYFNINGKPSIITGTNYYESGIGEMMWIKPNVAKLNADLQQMAADGINYIRIHYHHAKWFRDYLENVTGAVPEYYNGIGESCLPSEKDLRTFDAHIYLCQKYGIIYGGDLFTLLPEELGDPRGWYGVQDYLWFDDKIDRQKEFLSLLIPRYINVPGIAWDIYNEPQGVFPAEKKPAFQAKFGQWAGMIKQFMRGLGDRHLMTVGTDEPEVYEDVLDFYAEHRNYKFAAELKTNTLKPEIFQEVWLDRPPTPAGDALQLQDMRQALLDTFRTGLSGFSPWQWTNQIRLWCDFRTYIGEIWDDRLGCCVRNDGTLKPAGRFYRDFAWLTRDIVFHSGQAGVLATSAGEMTLRPASEVVQPGDHYLVASQAGQATLGITRGCFDLGRINVSSDNGCDLWYCSAGQDSLFVKADAPCRLRLQTGRKLRQAAWCDRVHGLAKAEAALVASTTVTEDSALVTVSGSDTKTGTGYQADIGDWQTYYWLKLEFEP